MNNASIAAPEAKPTPQIGPSFHVPSWSTVYAALVVLTLSYAVLLYSQSAPTVINADGIAIALFLTLLTAALGWVRPLPLPRAEKRALAATATSLPALYLEPTTLACLLTALCIASLISIRLNGWAGDILRTLGGFVLGITLFLEAFLKHRYNRPRPQVSKKDWGTPIIFVGLSIVLIAIANPFVSSAFVFDSFALIVFNPHYFVMTIVAVGVFILLSASPLLNLPEAKADGSAKSIRCVSERAIIRTLIGANIVFAAQTISDLGVLAFGVPLPDGASYSSYMYDAIWPLMGAAGLTALFTLYAFPDERIDAPSRPITFGVLAWLAQAAFLTLSCAVRIWNYIEAYGMTSLRVAGLFWIALIVTGLILVALKFLRRSDTSWLINNCGAAIFAVLMVGAYAPWTVIIANWNVERHIVHMKQIDIGYLTTQGPLARPALHRAAAQSPWMAVRYEAQQATHELNDVAPPMEQANWRDVTLYRWAYR